MDDAIVASGKDCHRIRRRCDAQHCLVRLSNSFLVSATRTLLSGMGLEVGVGGNAAAIRGRDDRPSVARPDDGRYGGCVAAKADDFFAGLDVPNFDFPVGSPTDDLRRIGVEGYAQHLRRVAFEPG
jgi:hypothetical protein